MAVQLNAFLSLVLAAAAVVMFMAESMSASYVDNEWSQFARLATADGGLQGPRACDGRLGECMDEEEEMAMVSESSRRGLANANTRFISYGALNKDRVPCNRRGQSYYNCRRQKRANPYRRGCSAITKCSRILN